MNNVPNVGDRITVEYPAVSNRLVSRPAHRVPAIVKHVTHTGRVYYYCAGNACGYCGPGVEQGNHRVGIAGSRIVK